MELSKLFGSLETSNFCHEVKEQSDFLALSLLVFEGSKWELQCMLLNPLWFSHVSLLDTKL